MHLYFISPTHFPNIATKVPEHQVSRSFPVTLYAVPIDIGIGTP